MLPRLKSPAIKPFRTAVFQTAGGLGVARLALLAACEVPVWGKGGGTKQSTIRRLEAGATRAVGSSFPDTFCSSRAEGVV
jgi:hypothetical protein